MNAISGMQDYFHVLERDFHRRMVEILEECPEESVHQLRTNMKKQLAFFHLLEVLDPTFSAERARESFGDLYKKAGKLRSLQVDRKVLENLEKKLGLNQSIFVGMEPAEALRREQLQRFAAKFSLAPVRRLGQLIQNRLAFLKVSIVSDRILHYFDRLFEETKGLLTLEPRLEEQLHELRRRIKELGYNLRLFNNLYQSGRLAPEGLEKLDEFQQELGAWHDWHATARRLGKTPAGHCPPGLLKRLREKAREKEEAIWLKSGEVRIWIDRIQDDLRDRFKKEPVEAPPRTRTRRKRRPTQTSFKQLNMQEGIK